MANEKVKIEAEADQKKPASKKQKIGDLVSAIHLERDVIWYQFSDEDIDSIGRTSSLAGLFLTLSGSCFSVAFTFWSGLLLESGASEVAKRVGGTLEKTACFAGIFFFLIWGYLTLSKWSQIAKIKSRHHAPGSPRDAPYLQQKIDQFFDHCFPKHDN